MKTLAQQRREAQMLLVLRQIELSAAAAVKAVQ